MTFGYGLGSYINQMYYAMQPEPGPRPTPGRQSVTDYRHPNPNEQSPYKPGSVISQDKGYWYNYTPERGPVKSASDRSGGFYSHPAHANYYLNQTERAYVDDFFSKYPNFYAGSVPDVDSLPASIRHDPTFLNLFHEGRLVPPQDIAPPPSEHGGDGGGGGYSPRIESAMGKMTGIDTSTAKGPTDSKRQRRSALISTGELGIEEDAKVGRVGLLGD